MLSLTHQNPAPRGKRSRYSWGQTNPNSYILNDMPSLKDTHRQRGKNWKKTLSDLRVVQSLLNHFLFYIFQISNNPDWYYFANQKQFSNMLKVISQGSANRSSFLSTSPLFLRRGRVAASLSTRHRNGSCWSLPASPQPRAASGLGLLVFLLPAVFTALTF